MTKKIRQWTSYTSMKEYILDNILATEGGCWEWPHGHRSGGYAEVCIAGKKRRLHRVSYEEFIGLIPKGKSVCHHCDNPRCVNPEHLYAGTATENSHDVLERGKPGRSILTKKDVLEIKELYQSGVDIKDICERFDVVKWTINNIIRNRTWVGIGPDVWRGEEQQKRRPLTADQIEEVKSLLGKIPIKEIAIMFDVKAWAIYPIRVREIKAGRLAGTYTPRKKDGAVKWGRPPLAAARKESKGRGW